MYRIIFIEEVLEKEWHEVVWAKQIVRDVNDLDELHDVFAELKLNAGMEDQNREEYDYDVCIEFIQKIKESD